MLSINTVNGENQQDFAAGTVDFKEGEGMGALDDYLREQYPEYYDSDYVGYRGNHSTSSAVNHICENLEKDEQIGEFEPVETEFGQNVNTYRLDLAISQDALERLQRHLDASRYDSRARYTNPLENHLKRVVQQYAVDKTDYERPTNHDWD